MESNRRRLLHLLDGPVDRRAIEFAKNAIRIIRAERLVQWQLDARAIQTRFEVLKSRREQFGVAAVEQVETLAEMKERPENGWLPDPPPLCLILSPSPRPLRPVFPEVDAMP